MNMNWMLLAGMLLGAYAAVGILFWAWDFYRMRKGTNLEKRLIEQLGPDEQRLVETHGETGLLILVVIGFFEFLIAWPYIIFVKFPKQG